MESKTCEDISSFLSAGDWKLHCSAHSGLEYSVPQAAHPRWVLPARAAPPVERGDWELHWADACLAAVWQKINFLERRFSIHCSVCAGHSEGWPEGFAHTWVTSQFHDEKEGKWSTRRRTASWETIWRGHHFCFLPQSYKALTIFNGSWEPLDGQKPGFSCLSPGKYWHLCEERIPSSSELQRGAASVLAVTAWGQCCSFSLEMQGENFWDVLLKECLLSLNSSAESRWIWRAILVFSHCLKDTTSPVGSWAGSSGLQSCMSPRVPWSWRLPALQLFFTSPEGSPTWM